MTLTEALNQQAVDYANDLRHVADLIEKTGYTPTGTADIWVWTTSLRDARRAFGGTWHKDESSTVFRLTRMFGKVKVSLAVFREDVCTQVDDVELVPDPDQVAELEASCADAKTRLPLVERTVTRWRCKPILS